MSWAWWDLPLTWLTNHRPSVLWHCWLGCVTRKTVSKMTYNVSSGTLNSTILYYYTTPLTRKGSALPCGRTRSCAITERSCDASCLSVVSCSSTVPRVLSSIISYLGFRFTNAGNYVNFVLFSSACPSSAKNDVEPCCHKQGLLMNSNRRQHLLWYTLPRIGNVDDTSPVIDAKPDTGRESRFLPTPSALDALIRGPHWNIE